MKHEYFPRGICPMKIDFELDGDKVRNIVFTGGCNGNLKAISALVDGWTVDEITEKLAGNTCGFKQTSCADQLTIAINQALAEERGN
ncbi:MAG: TIGR03905 family TSCPD domain-containing protein [Bacillota bacterium]|nr:TIGR03905 family TSCPD domain-containing protein [Bacillota bacterium]